MSIKYPVDCDSPRKKTEWLYRAQDLLRLLHNAFSKWLHEGLTRTEYDELPQQIKDKYPFYSVDVILTDPPLKTQLSQEDWKKFYREDFRPRSEEICTQINLQRAQLKHSTEWTINIGEV